MIKVWLGQVQTCRNCGTSGHLAAGCSNTTCFNCGEVGHLSTDCKQPKWCRIYNSTQKPGTAPIHGGTRRNDPPQPTINPLQQHPPCQQHPQHPPQHQCHPPQQDLCRQKRNSLGRPHLPTKPNKPAPQPPAKNLMDSSGDENPPKVLRPRKKKYVSPTLWQANSPFWRMNSPQTTILLGIQQFHGPVWEVNVHYQDHHLKSLVTNQPNI